MKKVLPLLFAVLAVGHVLPASAQFAKPEDAIKYRRSALFIMGQNFSRVAAMASGKAPFDPKLAAEAATVAEFVGKLPWAGFVAGTDKGDTHAEPAIWSDKARFDAGAAKLQMELAKLAAAAKTGNLDSIKAAVGATGAVCKGCHDDFRAR